MIYLGLIDFNSTLINVQKLKETINSYTQNPSTLIAHDSLALCYGKISKTQDMDEACFNKSSILLGRVFNKDNNDHFKDLELLKPSDLEPQEILNKLWGKYVYIHKTQNLSEFQIVVDITGQLPCFYYKFPNGSLLFSSDIEILFKFLSKEHEYNWTYLCSYIIYGNSSAIQTPFKDIYEVPPGCLLKISKNNIQPNVFWDPMHSFKALSFQDGDVISVLKSTLKPWISPYKNICVSLSGGLDSSSLVYSLDKVRNNKQNLIAFNYYHGQVKSSNELYFARKVSQDIGIDLIEIDASNSLPFDPSSRKSPLKPNKPFPGLINSKWNETLLSHLPINESCAILSGHGSDHIFMCPPPITSLSDYVIEKGFKGFQDKLLGLSTYYRDSLLAILKENMVELGYYALSYRRNKRHLKNINDVIPTWFSKDVYKRSSVDFVHPIYYSLDKKILPGKYKQINGLYEGLSSVHIEMNMENPSCYPFFFEPIINLALSFQTFDLYSEDYDRYPLRKSLSETFTISSEIAWRKDKGETTGVLQLGIKKNIDYILSVCMEGELIKNKFIDKDGLFKTITNLSRGGTKNKWPFLHIASCELFLKQWAKSS